jgi:tetratricopeptide (TPR) repeat protein
MSNIKRAFIFVVLATVSGIVTETAKAQTSRSPNFLHSPMRVYQETSVFNQRYPRVTPATPDDVKAARDERNLMALFSKASQEYDRENYQNAARVYVQIIQNYPQEAQAYFNLGVLLKEHSNNRAMSIKCLRIAYKLFQQKNDRYMIEATQRHLRS